MGGISDRQLQIERMTDRDVQSIHWSLFKEWTARMERCCPHPVTCIHEESDPEMEMFRHELRSRNEAV